MPNGRLGDNPISDTLIHGLHPFPKEIEALVRDVHARNPGVFNDLGWAPFDWERGSFLQEAEALLQALVDNHGDPDACRKAVHDYEAATSNQDKESETAIRSRPWWKFWR